MRTPSEIMNLVTDGEITTREQAAAIIAEEVAARVQSRGITEAEARLGLLDSFAYISHYLSRQKAAQLSDLFDLDNPAWLSPQAEGRTTTEG
jgi:hypothetical protein